MPSGITRSVTNSPFRYRLWAYSKGLVPTYPPPKSILHQAARSLIYTSLSPEQPKNAELPMHVTLLGIVTLIRLEQPLNACCPILVTLFPITTSSIDERPLNQEPIVAQLSSIFLSPLQPLNAELPILVTLFGISILVRPVQSLNA